MAKYKCPKCGMEYDKSGKCTMDDAILIKAEEGKSSDHNHPQKHDHSEHHKHIVEISRTDSSYP